MRSPPLAGLRVLDLTRLLPGPLASMHLADLGADVIKIEDTGAGDYARSAGAVHGNISYFQLVNRNKRSLAAWTALFERVDCCVTPVLRFEESLQNEQLQASSSSHRRTRSANCLLKPVCRHRVPASTARRFCARAVSAPTRSPACARRR
ncbi:hypothetical protein E4Q08_02675 [Candidatus Accumulibacter phosphatis]|uniref:Uncharacterized protein n=1 Tax=Candidatus Accumulibacter contiguus TaxID=2954381 RepID=A0ABX1T3L8_9PROT|nr:hypothetical protein [Candidatus Accumulibacter contiguus]